METESGNSSSSKSLLWMTLAVFGGVGLLLGAGLFIAGRVVHSFGLAATTSKDVFRTPAGTFRLQNEAQMGPGLPAYPQASLELPDEKSTALAIRERKSNLSLVTYQTTDSRDLVDAWYSKHLSAEFTRHDAGDKSLPDVLRNSQLSDSDITFVAERGAQARVVALALNASGTRIFLVRFEKSAPQ
jgi:hypothetical protein